VPSDVRSEFEAYAKLRFSAVDMERWIRHPEEYNSREAQAAWHAWRHLSAIYRSAPAQVQADAARMSDAFERALTELVNKIDTGLDSGDLLADARRASSAIDSILLGGDMVSCAHEYFRDSGDRYEKSIEFRIGWNACLDAICVARAALAAPSTGDQS
jgi:hypothetical protein